MPVSFGTYSRAWALVPLFQAELLVLIVRCWPFSTGRVYVTVSPAVATVAVLAVPLVSAPS